MTGRSIVRLCVSFSLVLIVGACATPNSRFPAYAEAVKSHSTLPIVLDVLVAHDISGFNRGYDAQEVMESTIIAKAAIEEALVERGFVPKLIKTLNGVAYDWPESEKWLVTNDWEATSERYTGPDLDQSEDPWLTKSSREFLLSLFDTAEEIDTAKGIDQQLAERLVVEKAKSKEGEEVTALSAINIDPALFEGVEGNPILFVRIRAKEQKLSKYLANQVFFGGLTASLTGGLAFSLRGSYSIAEIVVMDLESRQILWNGTGFREHGEEVKGSVSRMFSSYPFIDGETLTTKKNKKLRDR